MSIKFCLVALIAYSTLTGETLTATFQINNVRITAGKCEHPETKQLFSDTLLPAEGCMKLTCDLKKKTINGVSCPAVSSPPGCKLVPGFGPYPTCCPTVEC